MDKIQIRANLVTRLRVGWGLVLIFPQRFGEALIIIVVDWVVFKETTWKMKTKGSFSLYLLKFCPTKHSKQVENDPSLSMWRLQPASFCFVIYVVSFSLIRDHMVIAYAEKNHHKSCIIISSRLVSPRWQVQWWSTK